MRLKVEEGGGEVTDRRKSSEFLGKLAVFETDQTVEIQRSISKASLPSICRDNIGCDKNPLFENKLSQVEVMVNHHWPRRGPIRSEY